MEILLGGAIVFLLYIAWAYRNHDPVAVIKEKTAVINAQIEYAATQETADERRALEKERMALAAIEGIAAQIRARDRADSELARELALNENQIQTADAATNSPYGPISTTAWDSMQLAQHSHNLKLDEAAELAEIELHKASILKSIDFAVQTADTKTEMTAAILKEHWDDLSKDEKLALVRELDAKNLLQLPDRNRIKRRISSTEPESND